MSDKRRQPQCIYSVFGFISLVLLGCVMLAAFVGPPSPADSAEHVAQLFVMRNQDRITTQRASAQLAESISS